MPVMLGLGLGLGLDMCGLVNITAKCTRLDWTRVDKTVGLSRVGLNLRQSATVGESVV